MKQRTIKSDIEIVGIGLHKGVPVRMRLEPLPSNSGIIIYRSDAAVTIPLKKEYVVDTKMATVLGKDGVVVSTIEHLLSAIYAYGIDNLRRKSWRKKYAKRKGKKTRTRKGKKSYKN